MARFQYECFCTLTYDSELTYEEVLDREAALQSRIQEILEDCDGRHIDFVPISDSLQVQCAFVDCEPDVFRLLCADIAELSGNGVRGRLLLVNKELDALSIVLFAKGKAILTRLDLPMPEDDQRGAEFATKNIVPLSAEEREEIREKRQPPQPETPPPARPVFDPRGLAGGPGASAWPDSWVNPAHLDTGQNGGGGTDPVRLLEAWREQMRRRSG